ncbi:MAG: hypothetical protein RI964_2763 [Pseudomonadota bacterium]|jgi:hypothetical protein
MTKKTSTGSFDIILSMETVGGRNNTCLSFGAGLFRKLGWSSGDWLSFDISEPSIIALQKIEEPSTDSAALYARKLKLNAGFYKICFYSKNYNVTQAVELSKTTARFNLESRVLTLEIPEEYRKKAPLQVEDIAAAFRKL